MRHDPIELGSVGLAARAAEDRVTRLATRLAKFAKTEADTGAVDVIDAAFAKLAGTNSTVTRIDAGCPTAPQSEDRNGPQLKSGSGMDHFKRELFADLSAQLLALDHQRERLAELLRNIDRDAIVQ